MINFKTKIETLMEIEMGEIQEGNRPFSMGSQFNETILESAIANLKNDQRLAECFSIYGAKPVTAMQAAHFLSTWQPDELSSAWVD